MRILALASILVQRAARGGLTGVYSYAFVDVVRLSIGGGVRQHRNLYAYILCKGGMVG